MPSFTDKLALVTGSSTGIGKAVAIRMAENGADVVVHYNRSPEEAEDTAAKAAAAGRKAYVVQADLSHAAGSRKLEEEVKKIGPVSILVNNVGAALSRTPFLEADDELWEKTFQVNVMSAVRASRSFLPDMIAAGWGRIINISSIAARTGGQMHSVHYSSAKGALNLFTLALSKEVGPMGVTVNGIGPGLIDTPFQVKTPGMSFQESAAKTPVRRIGYPDDIAPLAVFLASDEAGFITGETYYVTGGRG
jgi:3-oxoacyl-[acyl-carrier protein] reductase